MARSRSSSKALERLFSSAPRPVYLVDDHRRLVYCNQACADWLKLPAEQLMGQVCQFHSQADQLEADLAAALCPPPEAFVGEAQTGIIQCRNARGETIRRRAGFEPLGGELDCPGVVVIVAGDELAAAEEDQRDLESESHWLHRRLREVRDRIQEHCRLDLMLGESPSIVRCQKQYQAATVGRNTVLVIGSPGSRREQVARAIYYSQHGDSAAGPLVPLSCSLLDAELLQTTIREMKQFTSELESPAPAALLLLDVDSLNEQAQAELLGFLELPSFDLQIMSTSQTSLHELLQGTSFSRDLANMLSPLVVEIPSLSERPGDIPLLAQHFLESLNHERDRQLAGFSAEAMDVLVTHAWPNNVDELERSVTESAANAETSVVQTSELPQQLHWSVEQAAWQQTQEEPIELNQILVDVETELIRRALRRAGGNKSQAARELGVSRARLLRRIAQLGVE